MNRPGEARRSRLRAARQLARLRAAALLSVAVVLAVPAGSRAGTQSELGDGAPPLALVGGTLVDLSSFGASRRDLADAVVVVANGRVVAAGARSEVEIPSAARRIDVAGKFVVPGLVDGFAGMNSAAQARAYLHAGVTTIVGLDDPGGRRGRLALEASPRPRVQRLEVVGYRAGDEPAATPAATLAGVEAAARAGAKALLLMYPLPPESIAVAVARARELGLATIGELGETPYPTALALGVQAFVHTSRYSLALAPEETRRAVAKAPFGPPKLDYYRLLVSTLAHGPMVASWAERLGRAETALIPTQAMEYLDLPGHANPWLEAEAGILDPAGIHHPADRVTGNRQMELAEGKDAFPPELAVTLAALERRYAAAGARYLAGSGTSAFGTMPGISLRHELELLVAAGLTPRQALAAATANYREVFGWRELGCVASGCVADLLVLARDPTVDLAALRAIDVLVVGGTVVDRTALLAP